MATSIVSPRDCRCPRYLARIMATSWPRSLRVHPPASLLSTLHPHSLTRSCQRRRRDEEGMCHSRCFHRIQRGQHHRAVSCMSSHGFFCFDPVGRHVTDGSSTQVNVKQAEIKYRTTWIAIIAVMAFTILSSLVLRTALSRENSRRDKATLASPTSSLSQDAQDYVAEKDSELEKGEDSHAEGLVSVDRDLTDWENKSFRYAL
jgi:hypothetical protein